MAKMFSLIRKAPSRPSADAFDAARRYWNWLERERGDDYAKAARIRFAEYEAKPRFVVESWGGIARKSRYRTTYPSAKGALRAIHPQLKGEIPEVEYAFQMLARRGIEPPKGCTGIRIIAGGVGRWHALTVGWNGIAMERIMDGDIPTHHRHGVTLLLAKDWNPDYVEYTLLPDAMPAASPITAIAAE